MADMSKRSIAVRPAPLAQAGMRGVQSEARGSGCTCFRLRRLSRQITHIYDRTLAPCGLRVTQFSLLARLIGAGPMSVGGLADALDMDRTTLTRTVKPLVEARLVDASVDEGDARQRVLRLTRSGMAKYNEAMNYWQAAQDEVNALFGPQRVAGLHELFDELTASLRDERRQRAST